ncbi:O-antigen ligase [Phenylobacterium sp.]|uniref:O-antigen ligase family protein n=1 Tax=Phenylobacterium sp. TaxID=1871053 RepID=UPI002730617E|nr:O-antigen ligase family protein [Phenylobacterium sp.]MDP1875909.1 O-antigen ligase family protein [Phenylobacterium sp.]
MRGLALPAALFGLVLLAGLLSLTPLGPAGVHPVWAFVGVSPGSATIDRSATTLELIKLLGLGCLFLVGAATGAADGRARTAVNLMIALSAIFGLWAFFNFTTGVQYQTQRGRLEGTLMSPNTAGTFFAMMVIVTLGPLLRDLRGVSAGQALQKATGYWAALIILVGCLLATASRGAALGTGVSVISLLVILFFAGRVRLGRVTLIMLAAVVAAMVALYFVGERLVERFSTFEEHADGRLEMFAMHWRAFLASPLGGYGLGTFDTIHRLLLDASTFSSMWTVRATHNVYLQWLEEAGLLGAVPMFGAIAAVITISLVRGLRRTRMTYVLFALVAANLAVLVHGFSDFALQTPSIALMWSYLLGLQFAMSQGSQR